MIKKKIYELAYEFRKTIEIMDIEEFYESCYFKHFPIGCCGDTSILLAKYYEENNIVTEYVCGMDDSDQSHAWLEFDSSLVIDITADQFDDFDESVYVSLDKSWYLRFENQERSLADFTTKNEYNSKRLGVIYSNIVKRLNK